MKLFPVLKVEPEATVAEFDPQHPDGADYVIVPAMSRDDDPTALKWLNSQAAKGAMTIGVCAGAKVVGEAGLLDGKRATTHWYYLEELLDKHPAIHYVADRRLVVDQRRRDDDGDHGVDADVAHPDRSHRRHGTGRAIGRDIGLGGWDARHASDEFRFTRPFALTVLATRSPSGTGSDSASRLRRHRRSVARLGRRRVVADLSVTRGDVLAAPTARPTRGRHPHRPRIRSHRAGPRSDLVPGIGSLQPANALDRRFTQSPPATD